MARANADGAAARAEQPAGNLRPFSREWLAAPPAARAPARRRLPVFPGWVPSERILSGVLVMALVLITVIASGGAAPTTVARTGDPGGASIDAPDNGSSGQTQAVVAPPPSPTAADQAALAPTSVPVVETPTLLPGLDLTPATGGAQTGGDPRALLPNYRVLSYYGHPLNDSMGILGEYGKEDLLAQLLDEKEAYEAADPSRPVMPAFEVIATVAQNWDPGDGTYLLQTGDDIIDDYVAFTRENGIHLILDLQIGHSTVADEIARVERWLVEPHVHVALDPEFAMGPGEIPGTAIGGIDAADVAVAQQAIAAIVAANDLPPKLLVVHRFTEGMITNAEAIEPVAGVQTVIEFDGFGEPASKLEGYELFITEGNPEFGGIKLFYQQDSPLLTPADIVALDPPPDLVIYQ